MAGLYIHIPFCVSKCAYCDFYSRRGSRDSVAAVLEGLGREMRARRDFFGGGRETAGSRLDTIYVGGGTPSLLSPAQLKELLAGAAQLWDCSALQEVTVEANPEDLTDEYIAGLARAGFDRLSIGVQSFDDSLLRLMNRRHSAERAREAVRAARKAGFKNITIDLIYGIPGMTSAQWEPTLDEAAMLGVQHVSVYHLTIEQGTAFGRMTATGSLKPIPEAESERQYEVLRRKLGDAGFGQYEISNFALPGRRAVHNGAYWSGEPYLGIGPSAHSFDGARRREWVVADVEKYIAGAGTDAIYEGETLSDTDLFNERIMTSLRRTEGLDLAETERRFGAVRTAGLARRAEKFLADGLLTKTDGNPAGMGGGATGTGGRIAIPPEKFLLSDHVISTLFE